jgi:hypothetical protein
MLFRVNTSSMTCDYAILFISILRFCTFLAILRYNACHEIPCLQLMNYFIIVWLLEDSHKAPFE